MFTIRYAEVYPEWVTQKIIFNPNYGGKSCEVPGSCIIPLVERQIKPGFLAALREDVSKHGFRNPILLYRTEAGLLLGFGGSRLRIAKQLKVTIPAIVVDYHGSYQGHEEVTPSNWQKFFTDIPQLFEFTGVGIETHYSLERNRRNDYDAAGMAWTEGVDDVAFLKEEFEWLPKGANYVAK